MKNRDSITLIFGAYYSHRHVYRICKKISKKFKIIIIENSLDQKLKKNIEKKYKNVKVIIPKKNVGLAKSYNIGIKNSKTKYVYLNCPDMDISNQSLNELLECSKKLKNFGILAPNFKNTSIFNNYVGQSFILKTKPFKINKFKLKQVEFIDNSFFIETKKAKRYLFDENFFLYFETMEFCFRLRKNNEKLYVSDKIRFKHYVSQSVEKKYSYISKLTRAWHYNWSKFYFLKKSNNYFYALNKMKVNIISAFKKFILNFIKLNFSGCYLNLIELFGIVSSLLFLNSFYRPKK